MNVYLVYELDNWSVNLSNSFIVNFQKKVYLQWL